MIGDIWTEAVKRASEKTVSEDIPEGSILWNKKSETYYRVVCVEGDKVRVEPLKYPSKICLMRRKGLISVDRLPEIVEAVVTEVLGESVRFSM